jgi:hypothetical protein
MFQSKVAEIDMIYLVVAQFMLAMIMRIESTYGIFKE